MCDVNLYLLRTVYEAFEGQRGDRVIKNFRKDNFNVLKKASFMMMSRDPEHIFTMDLASEAKGLEEGIEVVTKN
jgi:hypothetical protein